MTNLLTSLIAGFVTGETRQAVRQGVRAVVFYGLAAAAALIGLAFLLAALFIEVSREYGVRDTALIFGGGFLLLAALILLIHWAMRGVRRRAARRRRNDELTAVATAAALAALPALTSLLRRKGALGFFAAPAALVAYAIYRENTRPRADTPPDDHPV